MVRDLLKEKRTWEKYKEAKKKTHCNHKQNGIKRQKRVMDMGNYKEAENLATT